MKNLQPSIPLKKRIGKILLEIFSFCFWLYLIVNTFVYSLDALLLSVISPQYHWVVESKAVMFLVLLIVFLMLNGMGTFMEDMIFFVFYPFSFPFRTVGKVFWKYLKSNWSGGLKLCIGVLPFIAPFFSSLRLRLISIGMFLLSVIFVIINPGAPFLYASIVLISSALLLHYFVLVRSLFSTKPLLEGSKLFGLFGSDDDTISKGLADSYSSLSSLSEDEEAFTKKRRENVRSILFFHKVFDWLEHASKSILKKNYIVRYVAYSFLYELCINIVSFSLVYYCFYLLDNTMFTATRHLQYPSFLLYSAAHIVGYSIPNVSSQNSIVDLFVISQRISFYSFAVCLFWVFTTHFKSRYEDSINNIIALLGGATNMFEGKLQQFYGLTVVQATAELGLEEASLSEYIQTVPPSSS